MHQSHPPPPPFPQFLNDRKQLKEKLKFIGLFIVWGCLVDEIDPRKKPGEVQSLSYRRFMSSTHSGAR